MDAFRILGGRPLAGSVAVGGAKNAALPIMAAALLTGDPIVLEGVPEVADVNMMARVLYRLGMHVHRGWDHRLRLETVDARCTTAPHRWVRRMRASFCVLGPLLARRRKAVVALPGGCRIGDRPVDLHLKGLSALGATLRIDRGYVVASAEKLRGTKIDLRGPFGPTVTGTGNILSAAVLAEGVTIIQGAAQEPEIVDLGNMLISMGAKINGLGTSQMEIEGVDSLHGTLHRIMPDRIEAATFLLATTIAGGRTTITGVQPAHLTSVLTAVRSLGADVWVGKDYITLQRSRPLTPADFHALPYPGLPTDLQAPLTAVLTLAHGRSQLTDHVFPERFSHIAELRRLGASIQRHGRTATVQGVPLLAGSEVFADDLRGGAALVLAGLAAQGETLVHRVGHIDRGYERFVEKLTLLGADIQRLHHARPSRPQPLGLTLAS